ncbi:MAG: tetratricopeptide repeat protein, partial [Bdellovibrionia bacterium]
MTQNLCRACKTNEVQPHLREQGYAICFCCQGDKIGLSKVLQPQSHVRAFIEKCAVCGSVPTAESRTFSLCATCLKIVENATQKTPVQLEQNLHRPWLVKSTGRIFGPMSTEEVERGLRAKEISPLDEVTRPFFHWRYIREENDFKQLLEELRTNAHAREDTLSITLIENTAQPIAEAIRDVRPLTVEEEYGPIQHYDYDFGDNKPMQSRLKVAIATGGFLVAAIIVWALFHLGTEQSLPETDAQVDSVVREVLFSKSQADKERALGRLRAAHEKKPANARLALNLALLHIEQKETIPATRILEKLLKPKLPAVHEIEIRNALALASIMNGQIERARSELEKVLKLDPTNFTAHYNSAALNLIDGDMGRAHEAILKALDQRNNSGEALTLDAEIALKDFEKSRSKIWLEESLKRIRDFLPNAIDRKQEATVFAGALQIKLGFKEEAGKNLENLIEIDPEQSQDHLHDLMTFKEHLYWEQLLIKCRELSSQLDGTARLNSALGLCHLKANEPLVGREVIEDSLKRAPDDRLVQTVYGYVQHLVGQKDQADASLKRAATGADDFPVALILRGRVCAANDDWECAGQAFSRLAEKHPEKIQAKVGLAQVAMENKDKTQAQR